MSVGKSILVGILFIGLVIGLNFIFGYAGVAYTKTVGKAQENATHQNFKESQPYVDGKVQELSKLHHEWVNASSEDKLTIESTIRISFANFDENKIEGTELYSFLKKIKYN